VGLPVGEQQYSYLFLNATGLGAGKSFLQALDSNPFPKTLFSSFQIFPDTVRDQVVYPARYLVTRLTKGGGAWIW
jgi:hypothetical protein